MSDLKAIRLTTGGYGTAGFTFSVFSNATGSTELIREQYQDPYFDKDYNNQPFVAGVVYRFLGYHPDHMADEELIRVVFKETGGYEFLDPQENDTPLGSLVTLASLVGEATTAMKDAFMQTVLQSLSAETKAMLCVILSNCSRTLVNFRIDGPYRQSDNVLLTAVPEGTPVYFIPRAIYQDGQTGTLPTGYVWSIIGQNDSISQDGKWTPPTDQVLGNNRTVTIRLGYRLPTQDNDTVKTKEVAVSDATPLPTVFSVTGAPYYFEPLDALGPDYDGSIDYLNCYEFGGWGADKNHPNILTRERVYINGIYAGLTTHSIPRTDVSTALGLTNTTGHLYGFKFTIPAAFRTGGPITVELKPVSGTNAFRFSPKTTTDGCLDTSNLLNVAAGKAVTASSVISGGTWAASHLTDENDTTNYSSDCAGSANSAVTLQIDLNGTAAPQEVRIRPRSDNNALLPVDYQITGSLNGTDWFVMATVFAQPRTPDEIVVPVEKDVSGNYRPVRYVKMSITKIATEDNICWFAQMAGLSIMAPSLTPIGQEPPTRQPSRLLLLGDSALNEGNHIDLIAYLIYTNNDSEDVTASLSSFLVTGTAVTVALVGGKIRLTAADDGLTDPSRQVQVKANYPGLQATKDITVWNTTITEYVVSHRIDWNTATESLTEGASNSVKITAVKNTGATEQYTGSGSYSIITPYPNGMNIATGANAIGTMTLPINSITANLNITIRFDFPGGGGFIQKSIPLINVADTGCTPTSNAIDAEVFLSGGAYQVDFRFRTISGQPWKYKLNNFSWNTMDGLAGGVDENCYQFGVQYGPMSAGQSVTIQISPDGETGIISRTLTVTGTTVRTTLYTS